MIGPGAATPAPPARRGVGSGVPGSRPTGPRPMRSAIARCLPAILAGILLLIPAAPTAAQQDTLQQRIRASQSRLQEIQAERKRLEGEMRSLQGRARDISAELSNIERQMSASAEALRELDFQTAALAANAEQTTRELVQTRDRLRERTVLLTQRLRSIYERGQMHTARVLLSATSFGDLLNRYKYLHLISVHDRMLINEIGRLEEKLSEQERSLRASLAQLERLRADKLSEFARLQNLEQSRTATLRSVRGRVSRAEQRMQQLAADERQLNSLVEQLERARVEAERRRTLAGSGAARSGLSPRELGTLRWPVQGRLLYRFGAERRPNGVTLRRNGIGIAADPGTPVHAIRAGTVVAARRMEGFGPGVIVSHGGGFYSLYLYLGSIAVREGQDVAAGAVLGTVGTSAEEGPHLYLQIQAPVNGDAPVAVDPIPWLKPRS